MNTRFVKAYVTGLAAVLTLFSPALSAPPGEQLIDRVFKTYDGLEQYEATVHLMISQTMGRWTQTQQGDIYVALDRGGERMQIDAPNQQLVSDGQKLYYRSDGMPGKHLEVDVVSPLTFEWAVQQAPMIRLPAVPLDMAFLLAEDPVAFLSEGAAGSPATVAPDPEDKDQDPRIEFPVQLGTMTLTIDQDNNLIRKVVVEVDPVRGNLPYGSTMRYSLDIEIGKAGDPVADDRFAFDTSNSIAHPTMSQMMASGSNAPHPLTGKDMPALKLPDIDGNDHELAVDDPDAEVIVLDFWATWCGPCVAALPELQAVYDWAQAEGKPVAIYAVNQGETAEEVKQFWQDHGLTIPVLMDENFTASQAYMVQGIPQTVIIADGKVKHVHTGFAPGMGEQIKAEIEALIDDAG